jgi:hypothetical protein
MKTISEMNMRDLVQVFYTFHCNVCGSDFNFPIEIACGGKASTQLCPHCLSSAIRENSKEDK